MTATAALLTVLLPAAVAVLGSPWLTRRSHDLARDWAVLGTLGATIAAAVELYGVRRDGPVAAIGFLGRVDTGAAVLGLNLQADQLSAVMAVTVGVVATAVQLYSVAYLRLGPRPGVAADPGPVGPGASGRYPAYACVVSLFTAAMMLVVHAGDLVLLLIGWEVMGLGSYLLIAHHSERQVARAAAVKAFLVTRAGDVGVLLAVAILLVGTGGTGIAALNTRAALGGLPDGVALAAALLLLAGVAGKSAQFPLHTWLPDAMAGPTPVSALIHAATMVAAGVFLIARLHPVFLAAPAALAVAAVIAAISMLGAALAALAADDLKRLLAWSTISQVALMLGALAVATDPAGRDTAIFHLVSHAAFKALLFLVAGVAIWLVGTASLAAMGGLRNRRYLSALFGLGLAGLAGLPPVGGFWSKDAVLTVAEQAAHDGRWTGWLVYLAALLTTLVTGIYAGRVWALVVLRADPAGSPGSASPESGDDVPWVPVTMVLPLVLLAVPTFGLGLALTELNGVRVAAATAITGSLIALAGFGWAATAGRLGAPDLSEALPGRVRALLADGYRVDAVQHRVLVRPVWWLARLTRAGDRDVIDAYVRAVGPVTQWSGRLAARAQSGLANGYLLWVLAGAVALAVAGVRLA